MNIKRTLTRAAEKVTGRKCTRCRYNAKGHCVHYDGSMYRKCWQSITRPGFEKRPPKYLRDEHKPFCRVAEHKEPGDLTAEEKHQMRQIVESLKEASATAKDAGLLGEE